ncbi:MAG: TIGR02757 family protein [Cytophagales bacterium]|nr:MAG: TIGR02757 family protein [Cytophagales bacterium]TAF59263.1 MAG: TIGR02757 family protein [Cytophagales bacterium]
MSDISKSTIHLLEQAHDQYNGMDFIEDDPIQIPYLFSDKLSIEISGLIAATLAWGNRKSIIKSAKEWLRIMDNAPAEFVLHHQPQDLKAFSHFKHRTFQPADARYFIRALHRLIQTHKSLEMAFAAGSDSKEVHVENILRRFHDRFFDDSLAEARTRKHVATPARKSCCKRLNMFLRWMVRQDSRGVDLGIWQAIQPAQLICPLDVHVERVARSLGLLRRKQTDWQAALELTEALRIIDPKDPVRFDFALFGIGLSQKYEKNQV